MRKIHITKKSLENTHAHKMLTADLFASLHDFLAKGASIQIEIDGGAPLNKVSRALFNLAEVLANTGSILQADDEDDDDEPWSKPWIDE